MKTIRLKNEKLDNFEIKVRREDNETLIIFAVADYDIWGYTWLTYKDFATVMYVVLKEIIYGNTEFLNKKVKDVLEELSGKTILDDEYEVIFDEQG